MGRDSVKLDIFPMMSVEEVEIIDKLIEDKKPKICLEWGAGSSSVYFPNKHECIEQWHTVEHDGGYAEWVRKNANLNKVTIHHEKVFNYLSVVQDMKFDLILIDGLMRMECLMVAEDLINRDGVILLHDSGRSDYQKGIKKWPRFREKLTEGEMETRGYAHRGLHKFWV